MITPKFPSSLFHRFRNIAFGVGVGLSLALVSQSALAKPVPSNLGNGLDKLVASNLAIANARAAGVRLHNLVDANGEAYTDQATASIAANALSDDQGRVLVRITLNGKASLKETRAGLESALTSLNITAVDEAYRGVGIMNAYVDLPEVAALAQMPGVSAVILEWRPRHNSVIRGPVQGPVNPEATVGEVMAKLGTDFDQGVTQHRVDQINQYYNTSAPADYEGQGMQIACISNSYAAHTARPVTTDVTNFDLPGAAGNPVNTTPVYVFLDDLSSTASDDEGRGMCQIAYKMAPKAAIAFGTADTGEVGFANVIRGLAGITGFTNSGQTFAADTICDDVGYFDEPFFQDGIIGNGVDDASAAGVAYFSSAANDIGTNGYDSDLRFVANGSGLTSATNAALVGSNINLANVPTNLYAGGFHNFNPNGLDVAQTVNDPSSNTSTPTVLQWNEPYDQTKQPDNLMTVFTASGNYTSTATDGSGDQTYTVPASLTVGLDYQLAETAAAGSSFDGVITVYDPSNNIILGPQDTGGDETGRFVAPVTGTGYKIKIGHFSTTTGAYNLVLSSFTGFSGNIVQTQIYLLVFDTAGNYLPNSSGTTNALLTNEPLQLVLTTPTTGSQVQYVIARGNAPAGPSVATHVRYLIPGNGAGGLGPAEYFSYNTVTTSGHAMAATCNGSAAYSVFRPSLPEYFTSPGPVTIYYDKNSNRLATPEIRLQPRIAAADAANVSSNMNGFFASDSGSDPDNNGNFSGTSAAGPHAAAIGALVLQAHGGRRSVTPAQMTNLLQRSTFPHDLDPNFASGTARAMGGTTGAGKVTITISSDNASTTGVGLNDPNSFIISYVGGSSVTSFVFNPGGTAATAGNPSGGNNGVTYNTASGTTVGGTATYFENSLPGVAFMPATKAFTLGSGTVSGVVATPSNPSNTAGTQYYTLSLAIPAGNFSGGNLLSFTIGRGLARAATTGSAFTTVTNATTGATYYPADIFGGNLPLPNGVATGTTGVGMTFSGTTADGGTFNGTINNRIGFGYSPTDGYGFINAQAAVATPVQ